MEYLAFTFCQDGDDSDYIPGYYNKDVVVQEKNFKRFVKNTSNLKKFVYIDERAVRNNLLFNSDTFRSLDCTFYIDIGDGADINTIKNVCDWTITNKISLANTIINCHNEHDKNIVKSFFGKDHAVQIIILQTCLLQTFHFLFGKKFKKRFLFLSRNWNTHRLVTFIDLHRRRVLDNAYFTFYNLESSHPLKYRDLKDIDQQFVGTIYDIQHVNSMWAETLSDYWNENKKEIFDRMPYIFEDEKNEIPNVGETYVLTNAVQNAYVNSAMSLLMETNCFAPDYHFQCTEKTYKAMFYRHPFLAYGTQFQLSRTKSYGFQTFDNIFDESYDNLESSWSRIYNINNQAETLNGLSDAEFKQKMYTAIPQTTHNYNLMMKRANNFKENLFRDFYNQDIDNFIRNMPPDHWFNNDY